MKIWAAGLGVLLAIFAGGLFFSGSSQADVGDKGFADPLPITFRYEIDSSKSAFMVHAYRGGLAWFKGHDHLIAARDFSGIAELNLDAVNPASLEMTVKAASLEETSDVFTPQQKSIINNELKDIVLETAKYPDITFKSSEVKGRLNNGRFEVKIGGDLTLHGVTRHIVIPATVSVEGDELHAKGEFTLDRSKFNVNATSAFHGWVRVKHKLKFTFDIVGRKVA